MIAIPNMEKPKNCYACSFNDGIFCALIDNDTDAFIKDNPTEVATKVLPNCPILDIVTCEECKRSGTDGEHTFCMWLGALRKPTDFCSYGDKENR